MGINANGDNVLLGRGKVYFDERVGGVYLGERFIGNCTLFEVNTTDELKEIYSSAEAGSPLLKRVNIRRTVECSVEFSEMTEDNLRLALMGTRSTQVLTATPVVDEVHNDVLKDRYYQMGTATAPARKPTSVTIKNASGAPTYVNGTDYSYDDFGRFYIIPGGAIADGTDLKVSYTPTAKTYQTVKGGVAGIIEGGLRFIGDPAAGPVYDINIWLAQIAPDGAISMIGDEFGSSKLKCTVQADATHTGETLYRATRLDNAA